MLANKENLLSESNSKEPEDMNSKDDSDLDNELHITEK